MLEPIKLSFYRNLVVIFILLPFVFNKLITNKEIYIKNWKLITLLSVLSVSIFNTFLNIALTTTSVISSSLMPAFTPALIILLSFLIYNSTITVFQSIGAVVSFFGFFRPDILLWCPLLISFAMMSPQMVIWGIFTLHFNEKIQFYRNYAHILTNFRAFNFGV